MCAVRRIEVELPAVTFDVPAETDMLTVPHPAPPLGDPAAAITAAVLAPLGTPPLSQIIAAAAPGKPPADKTATIVVSDITRPDVPYKGDASILHPLLHTLEAQGLLPQHITVLVATGTHRASTAAERVCMFGEEVVQRYPIVDHCATDAAMLRHVRRTASGTEVYINTRYLDADIKILTGEIKPHFMAGFSGGRKAICPGLANLATLQKFHSPQFLETPVCHQPRARRQPVASGSHGGCRVRRSGFSDQCHGERAQATHRGVCWRLAAGLSPRHGLSGRCSQVPVTTPYEVLITIDSTINHYQAAKAAVGAFPILVDGGTLIQVANSSDGIGAAEYVRELEYLQRLAGPQEYIAALLQRPTVQKDQWEVEMWCKVLEKVRALPD